LPAHIEKRAAIRQASPKSFLCCASVISALIVTAVLSTTTAMTQPAGEKDTAPEALAVENKGRVTGLPLPRYVSLKSSRVNVRRGPGKDHPVAWVFERRGLPVEVTAEYDRWRRVKDRNGDVGWVWHTMLDGRRSAIVLKPENADELPAIHADAGADAPIIAYAEPGIIAELQSCADQWCRVKIERYRGWIARASLWGVYSNENFE